MSDENLGETIPGHDTGPGAGTTDMRYGNWKNEDDGYDHLQPRKRSVREKLHSYGNIIIAVLTVAMLIWLVFFVVAFLQDEERKNLQSRPGDFYKDYLGNDYSRILVEIDYVQGHEPNTDALDHFRTVIGRESQKDVVFKVDDAINSQQTGYTIYDINDMEKKYRDDYRGGSTAVIYILYLNGEFTDQDTAVGVSYHGSSVAIFAEKIESAATLRISAMEVERAVLVHEAGHLFGLVEINYKSEHDHQDPDHERHCDHTDTLGHHDCVMFWAIETTNVASFDSYYNQVVGDIPNDFQEFCKADLQKQRERARG